MSFRTASEAVRNGRIGTLKTIKIGIGLDQPSGKAPAPMPVPENLDYDHWLGVAPEQPYMEGRVHPQDSFSGRPGWITTEDFGLGMITNWGAHHIDIAHWAMGQELGGPSEVEAHADFMKNDVWTVHHTYHVEMKYPHDVQVILDNKFENGLLFEGSEGWVFCARGAERVTASDPNVPRFGRGARTVAGERSENSVAARPESHALAGQFESLSELAGKHRRESRSDRAGRSIRPQPRSLRRRVDQHEARPQGDVEREQGKFRRRQGSQRDARTQGAQAGIRFSRGDEEGEARLSRRESQRDSDLKPKVARNELPWGKRGMNQPERSCGLAIADTTPLGLMITGTITQGSSFLATLGRKTQSLWDWPSRSHFAAFAPFVFIRIE